MIAWLVRLIIAAEFAAGAGAGFLIAKAAGASGWSFVLAVIAGTALMPLLLHGLAIGAESASAAWWRYRTLDRLDALRVRANGTGPATTIAVGGSGTTGGFDAVVGPDADTVAFVGAESDVVAFDGAAATSVGAAWRAWIGETAASLRSFVLLMPWLGGRALPSGNDPARLPLVLVHGYFCNRAIWRPMAKWLAARGHAIESPNLEPPFAGIDDFLPLLDETVERLRARTGMTRIGLVGHSLGSLVIRRWLATRGDAAVAAVVTLGGPHQGTSSARLGLGACSAQMRPGNPWLGQLAASETAESRSRFTTVLTLHDNIVVPQAIQTLPDARIVVLAGLGHLQLASHPSVRPYLAAVFDRAM